MALPTGIESRSKDEWLKLANSQDAQQRKVVSNCLKELGLAPADYMPWDADKRVGYIMEKQGEGGGTAAAPSGGGKKDKAGGGESSGGGGLTAADRAMLQENTTVLRKVHDLLVVLALSTPAAKANAEEMDVKLELLGNG